MKRRPWLRVGRNVFYYPPEAPDEARAALVIEVYDPADPFSIVALAIFLPAFTRREPVVRYGPHQPGCWGYTDDEERENA